MNRVALAALMFLAAGRSPGAQRYSASGLLVQVDPSHRAIDVSCQAIPGYMNAMEMRFPVRGRTALDGLQAGMTIDFTLSVTGHSAYVENIRIHPYESADQEPMAARRLKLLENLVAPTGETTLEVGQSVPDFTLIDQTRQNVSFSSLAGKVVAIAFIYTSCPLPNYCFRLSNNFGILRRRFAQRMDRDLVLLSVTFDPEHDQPEVLARYARTWKSDSKGWYFLTGPPPEVRKVCRMFGMNFWPEEGLMTHSLHTVIVGRDGKVVANLEGNEFTAQQLGDFVETVLRRPNGVPHS
jgi:protein SCO1/2